MSHLTNYEDFLRRVDELGFMALSRNAAGLPSLGEETHPGQWHTGEAETDPWRWKDRAAEEKQAAYGCLLGGQKGFVSARLYPAFYKACHPPAPMPERWASGEIKQLTWQLWQLFEEHPLLNTSDVRRRMGVSKSKGAGQVDAAIQHLEREFYLTTAGVRQKVAHNGRPYGWPATVYDRVQHWAPPEWLADAARMSARAARLEILAAAAGMDRAVDLPALERLLWGRNAG